MVLPGRRCAAPHGRPRAWDSAGPCGQVRRPRGWHGGAGCKLEAGGCAEPSRAGGAPELGAQGLSPVHPTAPQPKPCAGLGEQGKERLSFQLRLTFPPTRSLSSVGEESAAPRAATSEVSLPWRGRVEAGPGLSAPSPGCPSLPSPACLPSLLMLPPFHLLATTPQGTGLVPPQRRQQLLSTHLGGVPQGVQLHFRRAPSE